MLDLTFYPVLDPAWRIERTLISYMFLMGRCNQLDITAVETLLPEGSLVKLFQIEEFHVLIGFVNLLARDSEGTRSKGVAFSACTCPMGFQAIPLSIAALRPQCCNHVRIALEEVNGK